jgi:NADPH2:quinone reductase
MERTLMRAVQIHSFGGPEVLCLDDIDVPAPGAGEVRVKLEASGVNYIDVYDRSGVYGADLPLTIGREGCGTVDAVGEGVEEESMGQRVAWTMVRGSYAEFAIVRADRLVRVPEALDSDMATAAMLQGITAHYLVHSAGVLTQGQSCLVHAAAGGVGQLLCQVAAAAGATVIGTVSTEAKAELARAAGADEVILYSRDDFVAEVRRLNGPVDVVFDGVGKSTFLRGLDCIKPRGRMILYGQASGKPDPIEPGLLGSKGSLFLTRSTVGDYIADPAELNWRAAQVFDAVSTGELTLRIQQRLPLEDAAHAHELLESRQTTGKLILRP